MDTSLVQYTSSSGSSSSSSSPSPDAGSVGRMDVEENGRVAAGTQTGSNRAKRTAPWEIDSSIQGARNSKRPRSPPGPSLSPRRTLPKSTRGAANPGTSAVAGKYLLMPPQIRPGKVNVSVEDLENYGHRPRKSTTTSREQKSSSPGQES